jgi:PAS domain S-box-containing protein
MGPEPSDGKLYRALLDQAEEIGGLGSWEWRPREGELLWSDNHFRLFGLEPQSLDMSLEQVLERIHPDDRERVGAAIAGVDALEGMQDLEHRIVRGDGAVRHLRVSVSVVDRDGEVATRIVGSVQDITEGRAADRAIAAQIAVSETLDRWESLDGSGRRLLAALGEAMEFTFGALMLGEDGYLDARLVWRSGSRSFDPGAAAAELRRPIGGSDAGRAWSSRDAVIAPFAPELRAPSRFRDVAEAAGIRSTVSIPVVAGDELLAVMAFLSVEDLEPTDRLLRSLTGIGQEVGHHFSMRRAELAPPVLTPRGLQVLELAATGLSGPAIARALHVSPATVKRHFEDVYARLGVSDRAAAVAVALRQGLIR